MFDTINVDMMKNDVYALDFVLHLKTCHAEMCMLAFGLTAEHKPHQGPDPKLLELKAH